MSARDIMQLLTHVDDRFAETMMEVDTELTQDQVAQISFLLRQVHGNLYRISSIIKTGKDYK